jgi:hypothetical protein
MVLYPSELDEMEPTICDWCGSETEHPYDFNGKKLCEVCSPQELKPRCPVCGEFMDDVNGRPLCTVCEQEVSCTCRCDRIRTPSEPHQPSCPRYSLLEDGQLPKA